MGAGVPRFHTSLNDTVYVPAGILTQVRDHSSLATAFTRTFPGTPRVGWRSMLVLTRSMAGAGGGASTAPVPAALALSERSVSPGTAAASTRTGYASAATPVVSQANDRSRDAPAARPDTDVAPTARDPAVADTAKLSAAVPWFCTVTAIVTIPPATRLRGDADAAVTATSCVPGTGTLAKNNAFSWVNTEWSIAPPRLPRPFESVVT